MHATPTATPTATCRRYRSTASGTHATSWAAGLPVVDLLASMDRHSQLWTSWPAPFPASSASRMSNL
eukprot:441577-Prorocentrum_lima.AAC.1